MKPITEGDDIAWIEIEPDGTETERTGVVWALAEPLAGMSAWWVQPQDGPVVLVARASRRLKCGRERTARAALGLSSSGTIWMPRGGRFVDVGEYYRESDPRSAFARSAAAPAYAVMPVMDSVGRTALEQLTALCLAAERHDDSADYTVTVPDEQ